MKLARATLHGVTGLADVSLVLAEGSAQPPDLFVLGGGPGSGKTRVLEAIIAAKETAGPYLGMVRPEAFCDGDREARVELYLALDEQERALAPSAGTPARVVVTWSRSGTRVECDRALARLLASYEHEPSTSKFDYVPETRQRAWGARSDGLGALEQSLQRLSKDPQKYSFLPRFLTAIRTDTPKRRAFADALAAISATVRFHEPEDPRDETQFSSRGGAGCFLSELSSSEVEAVILAATAVNVALERSIVFFDRPELNRSPERAVALVQSLAKLGRDNQWIVATGSRAVMDSVQRAHLHVLGGRS